ncbi:hypothetical protein OS493_014962 [Desmophyllum pertusum]|uniref:Uncharacterized protein n=1 Tax=Desmophyllum pertusum TaxID=174260 RepID=A0A9X0DBJ2_9CNID|nr:hypothetical protein OS493_014962 [Desmophyllum pertusum]
MEEATKLIALDHNHNASRKQAKVQSGEREGELRFRIAWSKVTKRYDAEPVLEKKNHSYLREMVGDSIKHTEGDKSVVAARKPTDVRHIMAPLQRPPGKTLLRREFFYQDLKPRKTAYNCDLNLQKRCK